MPEHKKIHRIYAAVIGSQEEAGANLYECVRKAGLAETTYVHALGDGAQWIVDQIENKFGVQAHFLADVFHMCEYLAGVLAACDGMCGPNSFDNFKSSEGIIAAI